MLRRLPRPRLLVSIGAIPALIIVLLVGMVLAMSVRRSTADGTFTLDHYADVYSEPFAYSALLNTIGYTIVSLIVALAIGLPAAWLTERTDLRGRSVVWTLMFVTLLIPGFFTAMGWVFMFHPSIGIVNEWFMNTLGFDFPLFNVATVAGMGVAAGSSLAVLVFILTSASLRSMDSSLEEAAATSGASFRSTLRRVTLPLAWPGILAAGLFVVTVSISAVDAALIIGLPNRIYMFSTYLIQQSTTPGSGEPRHGVVAAFATLMIVIALLITWLYTRVLAKARRYEVITGKGYRPTKLRLGRWQIVAWAFLGGYFVFTQLMPLLLAVWTSLVPFFQPPSIEAFQSISLNNWQNLSWDLVGRTLMTSVTLTIIAPTVCMALGLLFSWIVLRSRSKFRFAFDFVAFLPTAVPGLIFAYAALLATLHFFRLPFDIELYGSLAILIVIFAIGSLGFATRLTNTSLIQIHYDLEDSARVSGASNASVVRRIVFPLVRPTLAVGWLFIALLVFRELSLPLILGSADTMTLSMAIWNEWSGSQYGRATALNLIMLAALLPLIVVYWRVSAGGRRVHW